MSIRNYFFKLALVMSLLVSDRLPAQTLVTKNIRDFGAQADGTTNDTEAFLKAAAFFNQRGGNGKLVIPRGVYIVGKQLFSNGDITKNAYAGVHILDFKNIAHMVIEGDDGTILKYADKLKLGSFDPVTGAIFNDNNPAAPMYKYASEIGNCIGLTNCKNVTIKNLVLDGNNKSIYFGGRYDDKGIQLQHVGIFIRDSHSIFIDKVKANYFGLDGIEIMNAASTSNDDIHLLNSAFEYNCRQGLSWVGGNFLDVKNCKFSHSGKSGYFSPPGAGVDMEGETGPVSNGSFDNCEFIDNTGCGMLTGGGKVSDCQFNNCTFWGTTNWSTWVVMPRFSFTSCTFYGSIVHGYNSENDADATRYIHCYFEDKPYKGQPPYGNFLIECDGTRRIVFDSCTFVLHTKRLAWVDTNNAKSNEERATLRNCRFVLPKNGSDNKPINYTSLNFFNNATEFKDQ